MKTIVIYLRLGTSGKGNVISVHPMKVAGGGVVFDQLIAANLRKYSFCLSVYFTSLSFVWVMTMTSRLGTVNLLYRS